MTCTVAKFLREGLRPPRSAWPTRIPALVPDSANPTASSCTPTPADLARSPDGKWWVIEDRLDAPSGLRTRCKIASSARQRCPTFFHRAPVERLYQFFQD